MGLESVVFADNLCLRIGNSGDKSLYQPHLDAKI